MEFWSKIRKTAASAGVSLRTGCVCFLFLLLTGLWLSVMAAWAADEANTVTGSPATAITFANDLDDHAPASRVRNGSSFLQRILSRGNTARPHHFEFKNTTAVFWEASDIAGMMECYYALHPDFCRNEPLLLFLKFAVPARAAPQTV